MQALKQKWLLLFCCVSIVYFAVAGLLGFEKQLWNDELFTFYISQRSTLRDVWGVLLTGAEQLPPLFYVITRGFNAVFGRSALSFRLPEILGFWVMSAGLFCFVRRRSPVPFACIAMILPMLTSAFYYAYEARPYGLVLGFSALALLCWQSAAEGRMRTLSLVGMSLSLAAALSCHYYAILCFAPFALGEGVRTVVRRRPDFWIWIALLCGFLPLALFLPLIHAARGYSSTFWAKPRWTTPLAFYQGLLGPLALLMLLVITIILALYSCSRFSEGTARPDKFWTLPIHEAAAAFGFVLVPIIGVVLAKTVTGAFTDRYAVSAVMGLSIVLACSLSVIGRESGRAGLLIAAVLVTFFVIESIRTYRHLATQAQERATLYGFLRSYAGGTIPLVLAGPHLFFELSHDARQRQEKTNFIFLADAALAIRYTDTDDVERGLLNLRYLAPLDVRDFHRFCASNGEFLLYDNSEAFSWVARELFKEQRKLTVVAQNGGGLLFRVLPKGGQDLAYASSPSPAFSIFGSDCKYANCSAIRSKQ
jgi:dolichyl-phosphate-mannose-protein mannosyltransferase